MKTILSLCIFLCLSFITNAQSNNDFKPELKKLADDLVTQIKSKGNKKVAVASFVDLQGNITELGRYLAQQFSVNLIRNQMEVVDRSRLDMLMEENKMSSKGLLDPKNRAKLGALDGIDVIVTGTTSPFDNTVELTVSAIDISRGTSFAATDGTIPRTEAINALLRNQVGGGSSTSSVMNSPYVGTAPGKNQDPSEALMGDRSFDLPKGQCIDNSLVMGQVYFENTLKEDLVLYHASGYRSYSNETKIAAGTKNYSQLLVTDNSSDTGKSSDYIFSFHTAEDEKSQWKYGTMSVVVNGCKVKVHTINTNRLFLKKK